MQRYNFAWSTLLYSAARFVNIPQMTASTPWAGSHQWRSGNRFTGESNGYIYDVSSWAVGSQFQARVSLHRLPSLRAGHGEVTHFDVPLRKHFAKAVAVDPVKRRVAILEFDNNRAASGEHSSFPTVHVCTLDGQDRVSAGFKLGLKPFTEIYHMELYKDTVCFVGNFPSSRHPNGMESNIVLQNWKGARRWWGMYTQDVYCTGFQFITEDLFIMTTREKPSSYEFRQLTIGYDDAPYSSVAWAGHVRLRSCNMVTSNFADPNSRGRTPTGITLVRNNSPYGRARGPFYSNPTTRLFGLKYHYNEFDGSVRSSVALFGQTTVESWLEIAHTSPTEPIHWVDVPRTDTTDMRLHPEILTSLNDASNLAGWAIIGRRLFWGERWLTGWGLHLVDYNPGAGAILAPEGGLETHGALPWMSVSARLAHDPYPVVHTATIPMGEGVKRLIATEDGILAKLDLPDANFTMMLM
ncbi:hypothetical protein C8F04DRAFT_278582 [Mycena alexandri]|uniref:Uncharacterized protein n=1 Tax=Mycena alexandri TaxID=1745969 RepID=A0AAD6S3N2_9AGAR|nr:hypothetical protein C8F04DRAFT_337187 [Mycena alexandri]KAJ7039769.1 hypothetical protein C8F04DRAFT_278582 [Mycena alexandri]